jgi:hypothetical protein
VLPVDKTNWKGKARAEVVTIAYTCTLGQSRRDLQGGSTCLLTENITPKVVLPSRMPRWLLNDPTITTQDM